MMSPAEAEMLEEEYENEYETSNPPPANDEGVTGAEEVEDDTLGHDGQNDTKAEGQVGKPQIWIRIRPTPSFDNNVFEIAEDGKILRLMVEPEDRLLQRKSGKTACFKFCTDGILQSASQEDTFQSVVQDVVEKAMDGITGAIVFVGPEISGKFFTLFGPMTKYQFRGVLPRALEKIFEISDAQKEVMEYRLILSMFEIRKNRIKDLLTLGPYELKRVGDYGPKGLFYEEITSIEQGLGLILRGIYGQKLLPRESYAKYHTIVYLDIIGRSLNSEGGDGTEWRSRITFAKIASMPNRDKQKKYPLPDPNPECPCSQGCYEDPKLSNSVEEEDSKGKCCRGALGKLGEDISIRKDLSFLEQMFVRSHDLRKINEYYQKLESLGMYMLMKPPKLAPSQYFRQSKLAHCLKDIVSGKTEIRILLHVRPERSYLQTTLEAMRFAQRARCVPCDILKKADNNDCETFEEKISNMCKQLGISDQLSKEPVELSSLSSQISPEKMREVLAQATAYFEEKLDSLEGSCKDQVKAMFETFREMWTHMLEKDWAEEANKAQEAPDTPVETVDAAQTTEEHMPEEDYHGHGKRRSSAGKKKLGIKDKEGSAVNVKGKLNADRLKKKKGRRSSLSKTKGNKSQDGKESPSSHESQYEISGSKKRGSNNHGSDLIRVTGESEEGETEHGLLASTKPTVPISNTEAHKKNLESDQQKKPESQPEEVAVAIPTKTVPNNPPSSSKPKPNPQQKAAAESLIVNPVIVSQTTNLAGVVDKNGNAGPFKLEAWESFSKRSPLVEKFSQKQSLLRQCIIDHNETQKEVSNLLAGLTQLQVDLEITQQDRYLKGGDVVIPASEKAILQQIEKFRTTRDQLVTRLKDLREQLQSQKQLVQESKLECEAGFQTFCSETYGKSVDTKNLPLSTLEDAVATTAQEALGFATPVAPGTAEDDSGIVVTSGMTPSEREQAIAENFDDLKRIAKRQAQALLQAYPKRPPWDMYC